MQPKVTITYFAPDKKNDRGAYVAANGNLKRLDAHGRLMILTDGRRIPLNNITDIEHSLFLGIFD